MKYLKTRLKSKIYITERAQTTVEYVLLIVVLVVVIMTVARTLQSKIESLFKGRLQNELEQMFFSPKSMHKFPFKFKK